MKRDEARFILSAYRPDGADSADPAFDEALRQAVGDPELRTWFERSRAIDAQIGARLAQLAPPPGLREAILAGARMERTKKSAAHWIWVSAGLAAALVVGLFTVWTRSERATPSDFASFAAYDLQHGEHGGHGPAEGRLSRELGARASVAGGIQEDFATLASGGCRTVSFAGRDVLEVCFEHGGLVFHLYASPRIGDGRSSAPAFSDQGTVSLAQWSDARYSYVLVTKAGLAAVRSLF